MQTYVGKTELEEINCDRFRLHISVTQCKRKYTAFVSKLLQIPTKSVILTNCNLQQKHFIIDYRCLISITKYAFNCCPR